MRKSTKATKKNVQPQLDAEIRFAEGDAIEVSTDMGWCDGVVTRVNRVDSGEWHGYHYSINYVPKWDKTGKGYPSIATGAAIRAK